MGLRSSRVTASTTAQQVSRADTDPAFGSTLLVTNLDTAATCLVGDPVDSVSTWMPVGPGASWCFPLTPFDTVWVATASGTCPIAVQQAGV